MKKFKLFWLDGSTEIIRGTSISDAFTMAGYGAGALRALDYYKELKEGEEDEEHTEESV